MAESCITFCDNWPRRAAKRPPDRRLRRSLQRSKALSDASIPQALLDVLGRCRHVCVLTGSGVSAESGVPTFREAQSGLWAEFDPHELATPEAFSRDPELVWRWYNWRRDLVAGVEPNPAHYALASLATLVPRLTLITQNVDGLHQRAGSQDVIEFHGNLFDDRCFDVTCVALPADVPPRSGVPECPHCGGPLRPGVVWFGEPIPEEALDQSAAAVADCDVFFSIGTSAVVWPAAGLAEEAHHRGAKVVEINLDETAQSAMSDFCLSGKAGVILPELVNCLAA
jgi:NAD-dependent deacetylase